MHRCCARLLLIIVSSRSPLRWSRPIARTSRTCTRCLPAPLTRVCPSQCLVQLMPGRYRAPGAAIPSTRSNEGVICCQPAAHLATVGVVFVGRPSGCLLLLLCSGVHVCVVLCTGCSCLTLCTAMLYPACVVARQGRRGGWSVDGVS